MFCVRVSTGSHVQARRRLLPGQGSSAFPNRPRDEWSLSAGCPPAPGGKQPTVTEGTAVAWRGEGSGVPLPFLFEETSPARAAGSGLVRPALLELGVGEGSARSPGWPVPMDSELDLCQRS